MTRRSTVIVMLAVIFFGRLHLVVHAQHRQDPTREIRPVPATAPSGEHETLKSAPPAFDRVAPRLGSGPSPSPAPGRNYQSPAPSSARAARRTPINAQPLAFVLTLLLIVLALRLPVRRSKSSEPERPPAYKRLPVSAAKPKTTRLGVGTSERATKRYRL